MEYAHSCAFRPLTGRRPWSGRVAPSPLIANVPAVLLGDRLADQLPFRLVHLVAAAIFAVLGVATLLGAEELFTL